MVIFFPLFSQNRLVCNNDRHFIPVSALLFGSMLPTLRPVVTGRGGSLIVEMDNILTIQPF
jgi:hypothetical protein